MTKIVYNGCFGGFGISEAAFHRYQELGGTAESGWDIERTDPILVQVVEELGEAANSEYSDLCIRELEPGTKYRLQEYDGSEWIETEEEIEWSVA